MDKQQMPNINVFAYPSEVCSECGCEIFEPGVIVKKIPGFLVGAGAEEVSYPVSILKCSKCGAMAPYDKKKYDEETAKAKQSETLASKSGLVI